MQLLLENSPPNVLHGVICVETRGVNLEEYNAKVFIHKRKKKFDWSLYSFCNDAIKYFKPDLLHVWLPPIITIPSMLAATWQGKPIIFSYRSRMRFDRLLGVLEFGIVLLFGKKVISNNLISQSTSLYQFLYKIKNGKTIPNGVNFSRISLKRDHLIKKDTAIKMIFVGRLVNEKNIINLIYALSLIPKQQLWQLNIFGEGSLQQQSRKLVIDLGLEEQIIFNGFESNIYPEIIDSDLLIMPSNSEGMPNVLVEALAIKIPIVASNIPAIKDIVSDSGAVILVDPLNSQSIAQGIICYLNNQDVYIRNVDKGAMIAERYDAGSMATAYHQEYISLLR